METLGALFSAFGIVPDTKMEASQTHAVISMVNHGLGFVIVPRSAQVMQLENIVFRHVKLPDQFRSDMYLVSGTGQESIVRDRVKDLILDVLEPFRDSD